MADSKKIEQAIRRVKNQKSFIQDLLIDALGWNIDERTEEIEPISFEWSAAELRAEGLDEHVVDGTIRQIRPIAGNPWGVFILEFKQPHVFTTGRGITGTLRKVLRGLVPSKRKKSNLASFDRENLLFICNHDYQHFRFAHFKAPAKESQASPLAAFGWGPGDPIRTLCEHNLGALEWPDGTPDAEGWIAAWSQAFDVEKVTKRFYQDYAAVFAAAEKLIGKQKDLKGDELRMCTQTLFNRLMFLRFMERKGWLTFGGRKDYLRALYEARGHGKKSFYNGRLCPLFFEGIAAEGQAESAAYGRVPYLNGGLFERTALDDKMKDVPDEVFAPILSGEQEGGLFYRYNFTVEESTPLDIEVAVDPEMLGKVFEELVTGRHESGSYYTPRSVVSFMCREALKGYLGDKTKTPTEAVAALVDGQDAAKLKETHAREVLAALDDLKAVDPACGSGAYLLGLMQELIGLYRLLYSDKLIKDARSLYDLKLRIISQNLYGVDIDPFATNIAMLRLWLSLAVEADDPVPLPNLDFKIETGDSLLAPDPQELPDLFRVRLQHSADALVNVKRQYFSAHGEEKASYRRTILALERELREALHEELGPGIVDWRIQFAEAFARKRGGFDVVLANPPYVNMFSQDANAPQYREALREGFKTARGGFDVFIPFMERGIQLLCDRGMFAYITPNKLLSAQYADVLRKHFESHADLLSLTDLSHVSIFGAAVYPFITVAVKTRRPNPQSAVDVFSADENGTGIVSMRHIHTVPMSIAQYANHSWSLIVDPNVSALGAALNAKLRLEDVAVVSASATVDEAYKWKAAIIDNGSMKQKSDRDRFVPFVVSGNIRPFRHTWDTDNVRYLKNTYQRPVIDAEHDAVSSRRYEQMHRAKIIASGMSTRPTCAWVGSPIATGVATILVLPNEGIEAKYLAAIINSTTMARLYRVLFGSLSLAGGYMRFGAPQFKVLPIPSASRVEQLRIVDLVDNLVNNGHAGGESILTEIDDRVARLYGIN